MLNYVSCILPNISTLPNSSFPENIIRIGFLDDSSLSQDSAYLSIFKISSIAYYNIGLNPTNYQYGAGDIVHISIDGFTNIISYKITGTYPYQGVANLKISVEFLQSSPISATGNIYTFGNVIFTQSAPIQQSTINLSTAGLVSGTQPNVKTKSILVSGSALSTSNTTNDITLTLPTTRNT